MSASVALHPAALPADVRRLRTAANAATAAVVGMLLAALLVWAARQPAFALRGVVVEGDHPRVSAQALRLGAAPRLSGNFFTLKLAEAKASFEQMPWVRRAVVRRLWPMRLAVQLEAHQPAALWLDDEGNEKLVNSFGEVFEANVDEVADEDLVLMDGPNDRAPEMLAMSRRLAGLVEPLGGGALAELHLSERGSWRMVLERGTPIELGRGSEAEVVERTQRFIASLPPVLKSYDRALVAADLRHQGGYAVRLQGVATQEAPLPPPPVARPQAAKPSNAAPPTLRPNSGAAAPKRGASR